MSSLIQSSRLSNIDVIVENTSCHPSRFFIRTEEQADQFFTFNRELQNFYWKWVSSEIESENEEGEKNERMLYYTNSLFVAYHQGCYYRAKFLGLCQGNAVSCYLVDSGGLITVHRNGCYGIPEKFARAPAFAIRCHIQMCKNVDFSDEALAFFKKELSNAKSVIVQSDEAECLEYPWHSLAVDVCWSSVAFNGPFSQDAHVEKYLSQKMFQFMTHKENLPQLEEDEEVDELREKVLAGHDTFDDLTDKDIGEPVSHWLGSMIPIEPSESYTKIRVTHVDDYGQIYYHLHSERTALRQMRILLTSEYNDADWVEDENWPINSACVCKYEEDDCWYRGTVKENKEDQRYIVMFVDYGTTSLVHAKDMRKAYSHYSNTPAYARRIVLNEIVPPQGEGMPTNWTKEQISNLYDAIHYTTGRSVQVKFDDEALHTDRPIKSKIKVRFDTSDEDSFDTSDEDSSCVYKDLGRTMIKVKEGKKGFLDTAAFKILYDKASWEMRSQNPWTE